jgi:hypothetical protein
VSDLPEWETRDNHDLEGPVAGMKIKVDHRDIAVVGIPTHAKHVGRFLDAKCLIEVGRGQSPAQQADTLIHELFHAIWATRGLPDTIKEEECVMRLASGWATIMRDNIGLSEALTHALRNGVPIFTEEKQS